MRTNFSVAVIEKDSKGHIGVAIGGGYPICPSVYIVQIFDGSPASKNKKIQVGDDILAINGISVERKTKSQVAELIQSSKDNVRISYLPLEQTINEEQSLDIAFKKVKHRIVEFLDSETADALGLSRAILCNDLLLQSLQKMERNTIFYEKLVNSLSNLIKNVCDISQAQSSIASAINEIAAKSNNSVANNLYNTFGDGNRNLSKINHNLIDKLKFINENLRNYGEKAIPDTRDALKIYLDSKFEYLSYCLKVKEMEDEEIESIQNRFYLERLEYGNYEYRTILRCREIAKNKFVELRERALIKIEMLNEKHNRDLAIKLKDLVLAYRDNFEEALKIFQTNFPKGENFLNAITHAALSEKNNKNNNNNNKTEENEEKVLEGENEEMLISL
uniref:PRKCA-binding protein n=1 Tax=Strongyloides papillosus TaxID=174720 RepID=A0A0N5C5R0_STREA